MRKRFLLEGESNHEPVWIAVAFKDEDVSVWLYVFKKKDIDKNVLQDWVKSGKDLPEAFEQIERTTKDENLLPEHILVENVGRVREIEIEWADNLLRTRMLQGFDGELQLLKEKIAALDDYKQEVFDECANFWERIIAFKQENASLPNEIIDAYKTDIDILFEALKALRKDFKEELAAKAMEAKADLQLKLEILEDKLKDKPNFTFIIERLKDVRTELNKSGLRNTHYKEIDDRINGLFEKMSENKQKKFSQKNDKRINDLEEISAKMQSSIDWDKKELQKEEQNKSKSDKIFQLKLIDAKIEIIKNKIAEKEEKLKDILKTLNSLKKKADV